MSLTVDAIWFPIVLTLVCIFFMFRPYRQAGDFDFGAIFRLLWLVPIAGIWAAYFAAGWLNAATKM